MHAETLAEGTRLFDLSRAYRRQNAAAAAGALAVAGLLALGLVFEGGLRETNVLLALSIGLVAIFSAIGIHRLNLARTRRYAVEIGRDGLRPVDGGGANRVSWAEIAELRERPVLGRIELRTPGGEVRAALEYRLENFEAALAEVVERVRPAPHLEVQGAQLAVPKPSIEQRVGLVMAFAASVVVAWKLGLVKLFGLLALAAVLAAAALADRYLVTRAVEVREGRLLLHTRLRREEIDLADVAGSRLRLRDLGNGVKRLDLELRFTSGETRFVRPGPVDAFALQRLIERGLADVRRVASR